jgi:signal transduction histidine kinase
MVVQGEPLGGLFVTWLEEEHHLTPAELRLVEGISRQAAVGLSHARLVDELKSHQSRLEALLTTAQELSRIQPVEPLLSRVAEACGRLFDAESAAFRLLQGQDLVTCGTWGSALDVIPAPPLKLGEGLTGVVAVTGEALVVADPGNDPRLNPVYRERYRARGIRTFLGVPVKVDEQVVGVLTVRISREGGISSGDVQIAKAFATQAAVALENSRRYQETQGAFEELSKTKDQLVQAQKMEAIGQLAGGVAHDFNNLLTVITGRSRLFLARTPAGNSGRRDVELIDQAADRAAALTRQLLAFSRKQVLQPKALDPNALIGGLAPMLTRLIGEHIELIIVPGRDIGQVMADPGQIEQFVMNLVVNARDAMPDGGMVKIDTERRDLVTPAAHSKGQIAPGRYVLLRVRDSGSGMDDTTLGKIFEPFFTTKEPGRGTGLGLATVYGIVHQSGGAIGVDSAPGRGTTFTIYLPRVEAPVAAREPVAGQARLERGDETILLVEEDREVRELAVEVLKAAGYTVLESGDPLEALVIGDRHRDDIRPSSHLGHGHARHARAGAGRSDPPDPTRGADPLHVRLYDRSHRLAGRDRPARPAAAEAVHARRPRAYRPPRARLESGDPLGHTLSGRSAGAPSPASRARETRPWVGPVPGSGFRCADRTTPPSGRASAPPVEPHVAARRQVDDRKARQNAPPSPKPATGKCFPRGSNETHREPGVRRRARSELKARSQRRALSSLRGSIASRVSD